MRACTRVLCAPPSLQLACSLQSKGCSSIALEFYVSLRSRLRARCRTEFERAIDRWTSPHMHVPYIYAYVFFFVRSLWNHRAPQFPRGGKCIYMCSCAHAQTHVHTRADVHVQRFGAEFTFDLEIYSRARLCARARAIFNSIMINAPDGRTASFEFKWRRSLPRAPRPNVRVRHM